MESELNSIHQTDTHKIAGKIVVQWGRQETAMLGKWRQWYVEFVKNYLAIGDKAEAAIFNTINTSCILSYRYILIKYFGNCMGTEMQQTRVCI